MANPRRVMSGHGVGVDAGVVGVAFEDVSDCFAGEPLSGCRAGRSFGTAASQVWGVVVFECLIVGERDSDEGVTGQVCVWAPWGSATAALHVLVGFGSSELQLGAEVADDVGGVEGDELGAAQRSGPADEDQCPVAGGGGAGAVSKHGSKVGNGERLGFAGSFTCVSLSVAAVRMTAPGQFSRWRVGFRDGVDVADSGDGSCMVDGARPASARWLQ